ncbi:hypothetical protein SAMN05443633_101590 [Chryseobacterium arachidis]|uniref:Uncharacterized protein n=1 Tax=Chryseobacterium arachidis TaxID=1416778 RepID=A0A1M4USW2_9FLAO|nr:hypothetical protein SAMN05443633_101590 [Chryseobacterium arachidis]
MVRLMYWINGYIFMVIAQFFNKSFKLFKLYLFNFFPKFK